MAASPERNAAEPRHFKIKCAVTGVLAGAANGLFGAGGGMFVVPLFSHWAKIDTQKTCASSVAVILPVCVASAIVYISRGGVDFGVAAPYLIGGVAGGLISGRLFKKVPPKALKIAFALLLIAGGLRSVLK